MRKLLLLPLLLGACCPSCGFEIVDTGNRGVKIQFGKVTSESLPEGIYFYNPMTSDVIEMDVREFKMESKTEGYTKDLQQVKISSTLNLFLQPDKVHLIYADVGRDWEVRLVPQVIEGKVKEVIGHFDAVDLVAKRHLATSEIEEMIRAELKAKYVNVKSYQITNLDFNDAFEHAIEAKVVAVQQAEEAKNRTIKIQEEARQQVIAAEATAKSMSIRAQALQQNKNLVEYEAVQKWDGVLPQYIAGNSTPFIDLRGAK